MTRYSQSSTLPAIERVALWVLLGYLVITGLALVVRYL